MEIRSRNTNTLMIEVIQMLLNVGVRENSRNGPVLRFHEPVTICLTNPWERVNFSPVRDCNPFFHLMEALCMLGNMNSAKLLTHFAKNMASFSDDGETYNAFYGSRLRAYHTKRQTFPLDALFDPQDQLSEVIEILKHDPLSRQAVAMLWDPADLMYHKTKDKACNCLLVFSVDRGRIRMSSYNRSNDAILGGVMGANIVHLSMFHEYVALAVGLPMGEWWHHSNNLHIYETELDENKQRIPSRKWTALCSLTPADYQDIYPNVSQDKLVTMFRSGGGETRRIFDAELHTFLQTMKGQFKATEIPISPNTYNNPFIAEVAIPMFNAWQAYKHGLGYTAAGLIVETIAAPDWRVACMDWLERRAARAAAALRDTTTNLPTT